MSAKTDLKNFFTKLKRATRQAQSKPQLKSLALEAIRLITVRTRLGYGVEKPLGQRSKLRPLSPNYINFRSKSSKLSSMTTAKRSNLTFTGQLIDSLDIITSKSGGVTIGPKGRRSDGESNANIAKFQAEQGRVFMNLSRLEFQQLLRFYRRQFGDLYRNERLTFHQQR